MNYKSVCLHVLELDDTIRFAGIASDTGNSGGSNDNATAAKILAAEYRQGLVPLLTTKESELSIMQTLIRMSIRRTLEERLGKTIYATAVYEKVKRATIAMYNEGSKPDALLMVAFEKEADHDKIITKKILPFLNEIGKGLAVTKG
jgi:hypothetical protein